MRGIDMDIYNATRNRPEGPILLDEMNSDSGSIEPYRDDNGKVTPGGWIGYYLGYAMIAAPIMYLAFFR